MRTEIAESVIADAKRILRDHAAGIEVPPESLDWAVFIALANMPRVDVSKPPTTEFVPERSAL